ncbi:thioredoxin family protein [Brucepastera parasyntrophica]|uniref:thioredoxin family protein n=1 Tax=Brucepastera parasyntrophica TaxID=2880008 RepID=UPI00210F1968|nr:thioredoxin family protein [Brucepastera parasyntrophica]ULQ59836.1 thioredoxin family protein [Brucepastera parasyntrophica]
MKKLLAIFAGVLVLLFAGCEKQRTVVDAEPQTTWITDVDEAKALAKETGKSVLIVFTGSDWNEQSQEMNETVFTGEFFEKASPEYVLCNIDIVQDETLMDLEQLEKNYIAAATYAVQVLPFFVMLTPDGDVYGKTMATESTFTTEGLLVYLESYFPERDKLVSLKEKIDKSRGVNRAVNIDNFIEALSPTQREEYGDLIREVPELDKKNKKGLRSKYLLQIAYLDAIGYYQNGNLLAAGEGFRTVAESGELDPAQTQEALYMASYMFAMSGQVDNAAIISMLEMAILADPENPGSSQIQYIIDGMNAELEGYDGVPLEEFE